MSIKNYFVEEVIHYGEPVGYVMSDGQDYKSQNYEHTPAVLAWLRRQCDFHNGTVEPVTHRRVT